MKLSEDLVQLEMARLLQQAPGPEPAYIFLHTLVQETAYEALLHRHRREIHRQVARCYEQLYAGSLEAHAAALAYHYAQAGEEPQATVRYAVMAGDAAFRQYANVEAIRHYTTALDLVLDGSGIPEPDGAVPLLIHLFTRRGRALELNGQYDAAVAGWRDGQPGPAAW
jgi:predicted ATPase